MGYYSDSDGIDCNVEEFKALLDELSSSRKGSSTTAATTTGDADSNGDVNDKLIVLVFTQAGCSTCTTFLSRLNTELQKKMMMRRWWGREGEEVGGRRGGRKKVIVLEVKEREGRGSRSRSREGEGEEEEEECTLIHDMMHISSTPSVYIYSNRKGGLEEVNLDNANTIDEAVSLVLAKLG